MHSTTRSFSALLRSDLGLSGVPRNVSKPGHFANFGLSAEDDEKLTEWMRDRLDIAVWVTDHATPLTVVERNVLRALNPPTNILNVDHRWKSWVKAERKVMADQARAWRPGP